MAHIYDMENMVLKKVKLFCQFLMENFGDLVILVFVIILGWFWTGENHTLDTP